MIELGTDEFTLNRVAKDAAISIGSIYFRFTSKDDLILAVQARVLERMEHDVNALLDGVGHKADDLDAFASLFVEGYAELLRAHSRILRPIMLRASYHAATSSLGKQSANAMNERIAQELLRYENEFGRTDHKRLADNVFRFTYAALTRFLGLGSSPEAAREGNWEDLKSDLAIMCSAFLKAPEMTLRGRSPRRA